MDVLVLFASFVRNLEEKLKGILFSVLRRTFSSQPYCRILILILAIVVAGCSSNRIAPQKDVNTGNSSVSGGFYGGDRPPSRVPVNLESVPDAVPKALPLSKTGNKPYKALGKSYRPLKSAKGYRAKGVASWYGKKFHGRRTSSGEPYDMFAMTAAHTVLPLPSFVKVTNLDNGKSVVVKVNDRGPFLHNRIIDLSYAAAERIGITRSGTGRVEVVAIPVKPQTVAAVDTVSTRVVSGVAGLGESSEPDSTARYALQLGVFSLADNAIGLRKWLRMKGYPVEPANDQAMIAMGPPFKVQSGPFRSMEEAEQAQQQLQRLTRDKIILKPL
ncbi:MAG: septal ring lytic transglycosylase RlpA family protein [Acidiferrobacterales bacterium]|nr:septal ring lytic transglycosylase RlpA family protein [Acidiferrobacterales bacterium]